MGNVQVGTAALSSRAQLGSSTPSALQKAISASTNLSIITLARHADSCRTRSIS